MNVFDKDFDAFGDYFKVDRKEFERNCINYIEENKETIDKRFWNFLNINSDYTLEEFLSFDYRTNNYNFRSDIDYSIDNNPGEIWCFGDSVTYGIGVPNKYTWPMMIQKETGQVTKNFGIPGAGVITANRLMSYWLKNSKYKPDAIFINGFFRGRVELLIEDTDTAFRKLFTSQTYDLDFKYIQRLNMSKKDKNNIVRNRDNALLNESVLYDDNLNQIYDLLNKYNINYKFLDWNKMYKVPLYNGSIGRDITNIQSLIRLLNSADYKISNIQKYQKHLNNMNITPHPGPNAQKEIKNLFS